MCPYVHLVYPLQTQNGFVCVLCFRDSNNTGLYKLCGFQNQIIGHARTSATKSLADFTVKFKQIFCAVQTDELQQQQQQLRQPYQVSIKSYYSIYANVMQIIRNIYTKRPTQKKKQNHYKNGSNQGQWSVFAFIPHSCL